MKYQQLIIDHVRSNMTIYMFMTTLLITGIVFGAIIVNSMSFVQKQDLFFHIEQFFTKLTTDEPIVRKDILKKSFFSHLQYLLVILLLGLTIIGIPFIWLFVFLKGLAFGFSVGFIVNQLGFKGLFIATVSIAPQNMIIIPIYIIAASLAHLFSLLLFHKISGKVDRTPIRQSFIQYILAYTLLLFIALSGSVIETFISYEVVKMTINRLI